jgi:hypothetical protein
MGYQGASLTIPDYFNNKAVIKVMQVHFSEGKVNIKLLHGFVEVLQAVVGATVQYTELELLKLASN